MNEKKKFVELTVFDVCPDCDVKEGEYHQYGCDQELCSIHGCQLLSCSHNKPRRRLLFNSPEELLIRVEIFRKCRG